MDLIGFNKYFDNVVDLLSNEKFDDVDFVLRKGFAENDPNTLFIIGYFSVNGIYFAQDVSYGIELWEKALDLGCTMAAWDLGSLYMLGEKVEIDEKLGIHYIEIAANDNIPEAFNALANAYYYGDGVEKNPELCFKWASKGADCGFSNCMFILFDLYRNGYAMIDGEPDMQKELYWLKKYVKLEPDDADSLGTYGLSALYYYASNNIVEDNLDELQFAFECASNSAALGNQFGYISLAYFYEYGVVVDCDLTVAHKYFTCAADLGNEDAKARLKAYRKNIFGKYHIVE